MAVAPDIRLANAADLPKVIALSGQARQGSGAAAFPEDDEAILARHLSTYLGSGGRIYVSESAGELDGFVLCRLLEPLFFAKERSVVIDVIFVDPGSRRKGIGHALLLSVASLASVMGAPYVYACPPLADRGMQRFLARLSFAPAAGHRIASTAVLLRKLGREDPITQGIQIRARASRQPNRVSIDEIIAKRKRARASGATGEQAPILGNDF